MLDGEGAKATEFRHMVAGYGADNLEMSASDHLKQVASVLANVQARGDGRAAQLDPEPMGEDEIQCAQLHGLLAIGKLLGAKLSDR